MNEMPGKNCGKPVEKPTQYHDWQHVDSLWHSIYCNIDEPERYAVAVPYPAGTFPVKEEKPYNE